MRYNCAQLGELRPKKTKPRRFAPRGAFHLEPEVAKLSTAKRNKLPKSSFGEPGKGYPANDRSHAANAKARATQAVNSGRMSKSQEPRIDAKANRVLGKGKASRGR